MNEKFPRYLLIALALYAFSLIAIMGFFIIPAAQAGLALYGEFYFYLLLTLLPLILFILYMKTEFAANHGMAFRLSIVATTLALSMVFIFIISPLL